MCSCAYKYWAVNQENNFHSSFDDRSGTLIFFLSSNSNWNINSFWVSSLLASGLRSIILDLGQTLNPKTGVLIADIQRRRGEGHMKMKERLVLWSYCPRTDKGCQKSPENRRETRKRFFLRASWRKQTFQHLDLRLLTSRIMGEYIPVVLNHPICGNLFRFV